MRFNTVTIVFASLLMLAACSSKPADNGSAAGSGAAGAGSSTAGTTIAPGSDRDFIVNVGDRIFFDTDKYNVRADQRAQLQKQADWLKKYPNVQVTVEGHADERGTREYNLALGARRANAVKEFLVSLGVSTSRLQTVSYGKERPICTESNEDCWAQNRRGVSTITSGASS